MKKIFLSIAGLASLSPLFALAQSYGSGASVFSIMDRIAAIINNLIPLFIAIAVAIFIFGVIRYVVSSDEGLKEKGRNIMISSIIGLFVIVSVWGLVNLLSNTLGVGRDRADDGSNLVPLPSNDFLL